MKTEERHGRTQAFACNCGDDGKAECVALVAEVKERLRPIGDCEFATAIIASLHWDYNAHITGILYDHWGGMMAEDHDGFKTRVQFDRFEDGLAATWKIFADRADTE